MEAYISSVNNGDGNGRVKKYNRSSSVGAGYYGNDSSVGDFFNFDS